LLIVRVCWVSAMLAHVAVVSSVFIRMAGFERFWIAITRPNFNSSSNERSTRPASPVASCVASDSSSDHTVGR
jgi:hypothetical protein